jgi:hypothetical protein
MRCARCSRHWPSKTPSEGTPTGPLQLAALSLWTKRSSGDRRLGERRWLRDRCDHAAIDREAAVGIGSPCEPLRLL